MLRRRLLMSVRPHLHPYWAQGPAAAPVVVRAELRRQGRARERQR
ncbi:hypothetical protein ABZT34_37050 [Streptomyces sp. NPDC005329]